MGPAHAANRFWALITVIADHGLPVGVGSLRSFKMRAISRADLPASSANTGSSAFARSIAACFRSRP